MASNVGEVFVDLRIIGQPECCKKWIDAGWRFIWDRETAFIGAEHPNGGRISVLQVCRAGRKEFDIDEIGKAIEVLLNGGQQ